MPSFRRLALASTISTILLVAIGGLVRATDSGLGCGDHWPECNGKLIPVLNARPVIIEWSHRVAAMAVGILVLLLVVAAVREHARRPVIVRTSIAALGLVVFQALLGRVVVKEELEVFLVVAHLATAMLFLGVLITCLVLDVRIGGGSASLDGRIARRAILTAAAVLVLLMAGSYASDFGYMPGWPLQQGRVIPNVAGEREVVHFIHRTLAAVVAIIVFYATSRTLRARGLARGASRLALAGAGLFAVEILIGAANVWTRLHPLVVTLHLTLGALIWGSMVGLWAVSSPAVALASERRAGRAPEMAEVRS